MLHPAQCRREDRACLASGGGEEVQGSPIRHRARHLRRTVAVVDKSLVIAVLALGVVFVARRRMLTCMGPLQEEGSDQSRRGNSAVAGG